EDGEGGSLAYAQSGGPAGEQAAANSAAATAIASTLIGAAAGAAIGSVSGNAGPGAAIGAGTGLLFGAPAAANAGGASYYYTQRNYDNAYVQCMYAKGNKVPASPQYQGGYRYGPAPYYAYPTPNAYAYPAPRY